MIFVFKEQGARQVALRFRRMGLAAVNAKPAMELVADYMMTAIDQTFESQGRRGGGSWRKDTDEWLARKMRDGLDPRILHASLALRHSMTKRHDPEQILEVTRTSVNISSALPYAAMQNRTRQFTYLIEKDAVEMRNIISKWLIENWRP